MDTNISLNDNVFKNGLANWGGFIDMESSFAVFAFNNVFQEGVATSFIGNDIGTGSVISMSGGTDIRYSTYIGNNNIYLNCWGENRGILFLFT